MSQYSLLSAPTWFDTTWDVSAPGDDTVAGQTANTSKGTDSWSGFWQGLAQTAVGYAVQRDQAKLGIQATAAANPAPVYVQPAPAGGMGGMGNMVPLLLVGAAVVGVVLLATRK